MNQTPFALLAQFQLEFFLSALITCALFAVLRLLKKRQASMTQEILPPGPTFFMILKSKGAEPNLSPYERPPFQLFMDMARIFGDVFHFGAMGKRYLVVSSLPLYKELWREAGVRMAGRAPFASVEFLNPRSLGLTNSEGELWHQQRRFAVQAILRFVREDADRVIQSEFREMLAALRACDLQNGRPSDNANENSSKDTNFSKSTRALDPRPHLSRAVGNVIAMLLFSKRMSDDLPELSRSLNDACGHLNTKLEPLIALLGKASMWLPFDPLGVRRFANAKRLVRSVVSREVESHRRSLDPHNPRDYIDAFLVEAAVDEATSSSSSTQTPRSTFTSGMESATTTLMWALLLMATHPEVQRRVRKELNREVGYRELCSADRLQLPYVESVINEVQRFAATFPLTATRLKEAIEWRGWRLSERTEVVINLYALLHDPSVFRDPMHFNPEANFPLDDPQTLSRSLEHLVPFGFGKRSCIGEALARKEIFHFFAGIMQHFEVVPDPNYPLPPESLGICGIIRSPLPFKLIFIKQE